MKPRGNTSQSKRESVQIPKPKMVNCSYNNQGQTGFVERAWLKKHGKRKYIDFDDEQIRQLRDYFNSLDEDGSGKIFKL